MDDVDRKIISQLQLDGRTTLEELGKLAGLTSMGVKKRVDKLFEKDILKVMALVNSKKLNLQVAVVLIEIESSQAMQRLLERFKDCPRVVHILTALGGFNLIAIVVAEDSDTLESISVEKCSLRSSEGIRRSEFYSIGNIHYSQFLPIREYLTHKGITHTPCDVDCSTCHRYKTEKCVGCPVTTYYRGIL